MNQIRLADRRRATGRPLHRRRQLKTRRQWTWRSLFHAPIPQLALLIVVLGGLYGLATSRVFDITNVQVVGAGGLPVAMLRQTCRCLGANIFLTRPEDVRRRLAGVSWVQVHQVYTRLPDRLVIDASYRRPVLLWRTSVATYTVDMDGLVLYNLAAPPVPASMVPTTATVPIVYNAHDGVLMNGAHVSGLAVQMVLATQRGLAPAIAPSVDRYRWSPYSGLTAHSTKGWWFALGIHLGYDLQVRLDALYGAYKGAIMHQSHCNYVDLQPLPNIYCNYQLQWHWPWGPGSEPVVRAHPTPHPAH